MKVKRYTDSPRKKPWCLDGYFGGKRVRRFFSTEKEALAEMKKLAEERSEAGPEADRLSPRERIVFAEVRDRLAEVGASVEDAAKFFFDHAVAQGDPLRMEDLLEAAVQAKAEKGLSDRYLRQLQSAVGQFCRWNGNGYRWAHEVTQRQVLEWAEGNGWAAKTRRNYLIDVRTVFEYGKKIGAVRLNPTDGIDLPRDDEGDIEILSPGEVERLVVRCLRVPKLGEFKGRDFGSLLPYLVLGVFAGLRPERELGRMRVEGVHLAEGGVVVESGVAKSRSRRVVDLSPNAVALLRVGLVKLEEHWRSRRTHPERRDDMKICPPNFKRRWEDLRRACGFSLEKGRGGASRWWKGDIMRHSFASYHYAKHQDENLLKAQMGHQKRSDVLFQNYRLRVTRREAERFWGVGLDLEAENL